MNVIDRIPLEDSTLQWSVYERYQGRGKGKRDLV